MTCRCWLGLITLPCIPLWYLSLYVTATTMWYMYKTIPLSSGGDTVMCSCPDSSRHLGYLHAHPLNVLPASDSPLRGGQIENDGRIMRCRFLYTKPMKMSDWITVALRQTWVGCSGMAPAYYLDVCRLTDIKNILCEILDPILWLTLIEQWICFMNGNYHRNVIQITLTNPSGESIPE